MLLLLFVTGRSSLHPHLHPKLRNINLHNIIHSLICQNPRELMFVVQISLLIVTILSFISQCLPLIQATKEVNPHPHVAPFVHVWSVTFFYFFFLCMHMPHRPGRPSGVDHTNGGERRMNSNSIVSHATLVL